ncbi:MAG: engB [Acidimicrobiales bacterium]|nr:engB [Acidimicrobiales bacterium]
MSAPPLQLRFVQSASDVSQLPPTRGEVAIVGRSNVGKSSLVNALANRKGLAKVSKTPGRTQLLNLFELVEGYTVLDLPGYGYAKVPTAVRRTWPQMIEGYLLNRENLATVVALVDAEVGPTKNDLETISWLRSENLDVQVVATKQDKVKSSKREQRKADLAAGVGLAVKDVLWVSSSTNVNIDELRRRLLLWVSQPDRTAGGQRPKTGKAAKAARAAAAAAAASASGAEPLDDEDEW